MSGHYPFLLYPIVINEVERQVHIASKASSHLEPIGELPRELIPRTSLPARSRFLRRLKPWAKDSAKARSESPP